jgi:hypothetical protein
MNLSTGRLGAEVTVRPALLRWQESPLTRFAIGARWTAWLISGWLPTTIAAVGLVVLLTWSAPFFAALAVVGFATRVVTRTLRSYLLIVGGLAGMVWWTWTQAHPAAEFAALALLAVWPADAIAAYSLPKYRLWRQWSALRRGFPVRYAIMAAKAHQIQGVIGGERQLIDGHRPIVDHPAIQRRPKFHNNTAWALCSVPPGRNSQAFHEVLEELAASYGYVQRMELVFIDGHQTYGWLVVTFGPPLIDTTTPPVLKGARP